MTETAMKTYLIEPKAPLVIRSGRPFDEQAGADEARFPPPSTLAGALRAAHAESTGKPFGPDLFQIAVAGPLPVKLEEQHSLLVPKPADALYFWNEEKTAVKLVRAAPKALNDNEEGCDLPDTLLPVQLTEPVKSKPASGPRWWSFKDLLRWRKSDSTLTYKDVKQNGWSPFPDEIRTHVGIQRETQAADSGKLFQTAGLSFWQKPESTHNNRFGSTSFPDQEIGIVGCITGEITSGVITLGGERRLSAITPASDGIWPTMPDTLITAMKQAGGLSLTLLTPALFAKGWRPPKIPGLKLKAAAIERWQPHSGWDMANKKPRAGRKLVPAGTVFWYEIRSRSINDEGLCNLWLKHLSDNDQDKRDGFGLALPQPWSPK